MSGEGREYTPGACLEGTEGRSSKSTLDELAYLRRVNAGKYTLNTSPSKLVMHFWDGEWKLCKGKPWSQMEDANINLSASD